jgi:hypothetical protein
MKGESMSGVRILAAIVFVSAAFLVACSGRDTSSLPTTFGAKHAASILNPSDGYTLLSRGVLGCNGYGCTAPPYTWISINGTPVCQSVAPGCTYGSDAPVTPSSDVVVNLQPIVAFTPCPGACYLVVYENGGSPRALEGPGSASGSNTVFPAGASFTLVAGQTYTFFFASLNAGASAPPTPTPTPAATPGPVIFNPAGMHFTVLGTLPRTSKTSAITQTFASGKFSLPSPAVTCKKPGMPPISATIENGDTLKVTLVSRSFGPSRICYVTVDGDGGVSASLPVSLAVF